MTLHPCRRCRLASGLLVPSLLLPLAPLGACADDPGDGRARPVEIRFAAKVGSEDFACTKTFAGVGGGAGATLAPLDFRLYIHDIRLVDGGGFEWPLSLDDDGLWQNGEVALLDFEDKTGTCANGTGPTHTIVSGSYDGGAITGLRFKLGVPFALNHGDAATAASPLNLSGLFWNWQGGYKFLRIDMARVGVGTGVELHLGSTGCELDSATQRVASCAAPNRPEVALDGFDPAVDTVIIDYAAMVAGVDLAADAGGAPGCMSGQDDPECAAIFAHLGLDLATGAATAGQTAFRGD